MKAISVLALSGVLSMSAHGGYERTYSGSGLTIPDNQPGGATTSIVVDEAPVLIDRMWITVEGLNHTWAGDVTLTLEHELGGSLRLVERVGRSTGTGFGDSSDYARTYIFRDGGADLWSFAAGVGSDGAIPPGTYSASDEVGGMHSFGDGGFGLTRGLWTLRASDSAAQDTGSLSGWSITFWNVPAPGGAIALGACLAYGVRRRRGERCEPMDVPISLSGDAVTMG